MRASRTSEPENALNGLAGGAPLLLLFLFLLSSFTFTGVQADAPPAELRILETCPPQQSDCLPPSDPCAWAVPPGRTLALRVEVLRNGAPASYSKVGSDQDGKTTTYWSGEDGTAKVHLGPASSVSLDTPGAHAPLILQPFWGSISPTLDEIAREGDMTATVSGSIVRRGIGHADSVPVSSFLVEGTDGLIWDAPADGSAWSVGLSPHGHAQVDYDIVDTDACGLPLEETVRFTIDWFDPEVRLPTIPGWIGESPFTVKAEYQGQLRWREQGSYDWRDPPIRLNDGIHPIEAQAYSEDGQATPIANATYRVDSLAPPIVDHVQTAVGENGDIMRWQPVEDLGPSGVAGYLVGPVDVGCGEWTEVPVVEPRFVPDPGLPEGVHGLVVCAVDHAGNQGTGSEAVQVRIDRSPPVIRLTGAVSGEIAAGQNLTIRASDLALSQIEIVHEGETAETDTDRLKIDTTGWTEGAHTIQVAAHDDFGHVVTETFEVQVDNRLPIINNVSFGGDGAPVPPGGQIEVAVTVEDDGSDIERVFVETSWGSTKRLGRDTTPSSWSARLDVPRNLTSSEHEMKIVAKNALGFEQSVMVPLPPIDDTPPTIGMNVGGTVYLPSGILWEVPATDDGGLERIVVRVGDTSLVADDHGRVDLSGIPDGSYAMTIEAVDRVGHRTVWNVGVVLDGEAPRVTADWPAVVDEGVLLPVSIKDQTPVTVAVVIDDAYTQRWGREGVSTSGLSEGTHTFTIRAEDLAANSQVLEKTVAVDARPPVVRFNVPPGLPILAGAVEWDIHDASLATVEVFLNGVLRDDLRDLGRFGLSDVAAGEYELKIVAEDAFDRRTVKSIQVIRSAPVDGGADAPPSAFRFARGTGDIIEVEVPYALPDHVGLRMRLSTPLGASHEVGAVRTGERSFLVQSPVGLDTVSRAELVMSDPVSDAEVVFYDAPMALASEPAVKVQESPIGHALFALLALLFMGARRGPVYGRAAS